MTTLTIHLPDSLAKRAGQTGLLDQERLSKLVSDYLSVQIERQATSLPGGDTPITQWLEKNPLPEHAHRSSQAIDASIAENKQAWD